MLSKPLFFRSPLPESLAGRQVKYRKFPFISNVNLINSFINKMIDQQLIFFLLHYTVLMHCNCFQSKITTTSLKKLVTAPKKRELDEKKEKIKNNKKMASLIFGYWT